MLASGELLDGRYRLDRVVATGGAGAVWQATDTVLGRRVAVKVLRGDGTQALGDAARFLDEARALAVLRHPGVVDVYDFGEADGVAYLVMAYVEGEPLRDLIARHGSLAPGKAMSIIAGVARALAGVHAAGIIHRDVKPGNLILQPDGSAVLVDFGIAHHPRAIHLTAADEVIGTPLYIAPEQVSKQPVTPATDLYALGAVAYHCLTGQPPFPGDNPIAVALQHLSDDPPPLPAGVPARVRAVVATAMAKDPADRFPDAAAMAEAAQRSTGPATATSQTAKAQTAVAQTPATQTVTATTAMKAAGPTALLDATAPIGPPPARRRFPHGVLAWSTTALALVAMVVLLLQTRPLSTVPDPPTEPLPGQSETVGPGVPVGDNDVGDSTPTGSPEPTGPPAPAPAATTPVPTPAPTAEPEATQPPPPEPTGAPTTTVAPQPQVFTTPPVAP